MDIKLFLNILLVACITMVSFLVRHWRYPRFVLSFPPASFCGPIPQPSQGPFCTQFFTRTSYLMKIYIIVFNFSVIRSQQNFAHATTAQLSWHVQNFCSDPFIIILVTTKYDIQEIVNVREKLLVWWACDFMDLLGANDRWSIRD